MKANTQRVLRYVLDMALRMLHPIMPHITERVWQLIPKQTDTKAIIVAEFPNFKEELEFPKEAEEMELVLKQLPH